MRTTRSSVIRLLTFLALIAAAGARGSVHAQQQSGTPAAMVGITGTTDAAGLFAGTFLITRFDSEVANGGIVAVGSVSGILNGRNIVTRATIPLTLSPSDALQPVQSQADTSNSCDVRIELAPSSFPALGSVVTLDAASFDITASEPDPTSAVPETSGTSSGGTPNQVTVPTTTTSTQAVPMTQLGTIIPIAPSGTAVPTSTIGAPRPGVIVSVPQVTSPAAAASPQQLGQFLCSASRLSQSPSSSAQLVALLNQVLLTLRQ